MDNWKPIETVPKEIKQMFVVIAFDVKPFPHSNALYTSDPWCVFMGLNNEFIRWPHDFKPTHWIPLPSQPEN